MSEQSQLQLNLGSYSVAVPADPEEFLQENHDILLAYIKHLEQVQEEKEQLKEKVEQLKEDLDNKDNSKLTEAQALTDRIQELTDENEGLREQLREQQDEQGHPDRIEELKVVNQDLQDDLDTEQDLNRNVKDRYTEELQKNAQLSQQLISVTNKYLELKAKLATLEKAQRSTIYIYQVASTQFTVTYDIKILCDNSKDRNPKLNPQSNDVVFRKLDSLMGVGFKDPFKNEIQSAIPGCHIVSGMIEVPKGAATAVVQFAEQFFTL